MRTRATWQLFGLVSLGLATSTLACKSHGDGAPSASSSASVAPPPATLVSPVEPAAPAPTSSAQLPEGPVLAIQAGRGVGPIRIGATVTTIERLMEAPCEVKNAEVCRYIKRGVEFQLDKGGVTERILVHRKDRPAGPDARGTARAYGFFNGGIPPGVGLGMIPKAVLEILGPPLKSERVTTKNDFNTIDRDTYPGGMVLEYDEYTNGKVMLGGVIIERPNR